jgi:hypothetical protein
MLPTNTDFDGGFVEKPDILLVVKVFSESAELVDVGRTSSQRLQCKLLLENEG